MKLYTIHNFSEKENCELVWTPVTWVTIPGTRVLPLIEMVVRTQAQISVVATGSIVYWARAMRRHWVTSTINSQWTNLGSHRLWVNMVRTIARIENVCRLHWTMIPMTARTDRRWIVCHIDTISDWWRLIGSRVGDLKAMIAATLSENLALPTTEVRKGKRLGATY